MKPLIPLLALSLITACAPNYLQRGNNAYHNKEIRQAFDNYLVCAKQGNSACINNIGVINRDLGRTELAIEWLTLSARLGNEGAALNLKQMGADVPLADLKWPNYQASTSNMDGAFAVFNTLLQSHNRSLDRQNNIKTCDGLVSGNIVTVNCN